MADALLSLQAERTAQRADRLLLPVRWVCDWACCDAFCSSSAAADVRRKDAAVREQRSVCSVTGEEQARCINAVRVLAALCRFNKDTECGWPASSLAFSDALCTWLHVRLSHAPRPALTPMSCEAVSLGSLGIETKRGRSCLQSCTASYVPRLVAHFLRQLGDAGFLPWRWVHLMAAGLTSSSDTPWHSRSVAAPPAFCGLHVVCQQP